MQAVIVHIPKAAGTSLKNAIAEETESNNIYFDYHRPLAKGNLQRNMDCLFTSIKNKPRSEQIIFGHFLVGKYAKFNGIHFKKRPNTVYITFLRDPLQRAISHFFFWKRTDVIGHRVWEQFTQENWDLEQFLLSKEHRNFQAKFLWRFSLMQFDFIGLTEHFNDSIKMLRIIFPLFKNLTIREENANPNRVGNSYLISPKLAKQFKQQNQQDYALYHQAIDIFTQQKLKLLAYG
ncbi:sulfotransferase family protein [Candidatus Nitrosacidococcus sp. I8]|uniref:sulfotransferase family protein n=1 Tax=Candidatus Nitrosacidococcus sp. I8 TaxID=2942908 RepID=UPI0022262767|nr:sulfotransferase family protein [Candidatus Nitrosacidococcus sp. I8]CAH9017715.1 hypothetical protein NURINAE_00513 [Candidatus Nitrosacidococcus sp. I8]